MLKHTKEAKPNYSLFSFNLLTNQCKLVAKHEFTVEELKAGVKKYYDFISGTGIIYMQDLNLKRAEKRFKKFIRHKYGNLQLVK